MGGLVGHWMDGWVTGQMDGSLDRLVMGWSMGSGSVDG